MDRVRADRVVLRDRDAGPAAALGARVDVEDGDPVCRGRVTPGRPDGVLHRVGRGAGVDVRCRGDGGPAGPGKDLGLALSAGGAAPVGPVFVEGRVGTAAAEDEVNRAPAGVEHPAVDRGHRARPEGVDLGAGGHLMANVGVGAAHRERPFVVVVVTADDQVHLVPVEQW